MNATRSRQSTGPSVSDDLSGPVAFSAPNRHPLRRKMALGRKPAMVRLTRIYTRGGDGGETSLGDGARVKKYALRVEAYGHVDEANAAIGLARLHTSGRHALPDRHMLARIQNDLFDLGADLCDARRRRSPARRAAHPAAAGRAAGARDRRPECRAGAARLLRAARRHRGGGLLHLARTVVRRAERLMIALADEERGQSRGAQIFQPAVRPSLRARPDHLNDKGRPDVLWQPGRASLTRNTRSGGPQAQGLPWRLSHMHNSAPTSSFRLL